MYWKQWGLYVLKNSNVYVPYTKILTCIYILHAFIQNLSTTLTETVGFIQCNILHCCCYFIYCYLLFIYLRLLCFAVVLFCPGCQAHDVTLESNFPTLCFLNNNLLQNIRPLLLSTLLRHATEARYWGTLLRHATEARYWGKLLRHARVHTTEAGTGLCVDSHHSLIYFIHDYILHWISILWKVIKDIFI